MSSPGAALNAVRIGYARVSTRSQELQLQLDALQAAACREVVVERASTRSERPLLHQALASMRAGDTLVVYKPDRVARSMKELLVLLEDQLHARGIALEILSGICAGVHRPDGATIGDRMLFMVASMAAEMERELIRERTLDGLRAAAAQGRHGGRPRTVGEDDLLVARARQARGESVTAIAKHLGVGRSTLYRALETADTAPADPTESIEQDEPQGAGVPGVVPIEASAIVAEAPVPTAAAVVPAVVEDPAVPARASTVRPRARRSAPAPEAPAVSESGRVVDMSEGLGQGWRLVELAEKGSGRWRVEHDGQARGTIAQESTVRGRRGWRARRPDGMDVRAHGTLALSATSDLWRTRDLAAAGLQLDHEQHPPRRRRKAGARPTREDGAR